MSTTGGIETVLAEHRLVVSGDCECGYRIAFTNRPWVPTHEAHVADSVRAHLLSDAVVERAAGAHWEAWSFSHASRLGINDAAEHGRAMVRAALAAAVGSDTDG
jgi:hypothetical protein